MPNKQIEDLNNIDTLSMNDQFIVNDVSDISSDPTGTVKNISAAQMGILETRVSFADADVTGAVGVLDCVDISGYTADRDYILPTTAAVGDRAGVCITTGDDSYELDLHTPSASTDTINGVDSSVGTASWSRLFITGEVVIFRCVVANSAWIVEYDGRIPCTTKMIRNTAQSIPNDALTKVLLNYNEIDVGNLGDVTTNNRIDIRRTGNYEIKAYMVLNNIGNGEWVLIEIHNSAERKAWSKNYNAQASTSPIAAGVDLLKNLSEGDYLEFYTRHTQGAAQDTYVLDEGLDPRLELVEQL